MPFVGTSFVTILLNEPHTGQLTFIPSGNTNGNLDFEDEELVLVVETFVGAAVLTSDAGACLSLVMFIFCVLLRFPVTLSFSF